MYVDVGFLFLRTKQVQIFWTLCQSILRQQFNLHLMMKYVT
jgi:hypothetical protein